MIYTLCIHICILLVQYCRDSVLSCTNANAIELLPVLQGLGMW